MKKVAVCVPSHGSWQPRMALATVGLVRTTKDVFTCLSDDNPEGNISKLRNYLVMQAKRMEASHILWISPNVIFPQNALSRLLAHDKDIVAVFPQSCKPVSEYTKHLVEPEKWESGGLLKMNPNRPHAPHDLCLIKTHVYDSIKYPWYFDQYDESEKSEKNPLGYVTETQIFSEVVSFAEVEIFCDADLSSEVLKIENTINRSA